MNLTYLLNDFPFRVWTLVLSADAQRGCSPFRQIRSVPKRIEKEEESVEDQYFVSSLNSIPLQCFFSPIVTPSHHRVDSISPSLSLLLPFTVSIATHFASTWILRHVPFSFSCHQAFFPPLAATPTLLSPSPSVRVAIAPTKESFNAKKKWN
jgi:hypothetical protein